MFRSTASDDNGRAWGTHVWLRARDVSFEIQDEPLEAWFEAMHPVWSRELATRAFRLALRRRLRRAGKGGDDRREDGVEDEDEDENEDDVENARFGVGVGWVYGGVRA